ncbi:MAG: hypothetical protein HGA96_00180 [Desulfobulbaceae bacterium]|nr:hypothetical protein [Desulfobulbaceae bacterium]
MSIATLAPQKFDFQDMVCIEMMLRFEHLDGAQFVVEPKDGEDCELLFGPVMPGAKAEIQVKGATGTVSIEGIASCLAHSPPHKDSGTLLERLLNDPNRIVILAMSGRCDDTTSVFVVPFNWSGEHHPENKIKLADAKALLDAFAVAQIPGKEDGTLKTARQSHFRHLASATDPVVMRNALRRLIVLEKLDEAELERRCADKLRSSFRVPGDRITDVIARLRGAIKTSKNQGAEAFPQLRLVLREAAQPSVSPPDYVTRNDEDNWSTDLSRKNVLLLSGSPRVGKTYTARCIAANFDKHGYEIREIKEVEATVRFLLEPGNSSRLAVLDDPLGGAHAVPDATKNLSIISDLIPRLRPNRKLIISQGQDRLLMASRKTTLQEIETAGNKWQDLGNPAKIFLVRLWQMLSETWKVEETVKQVVLDALGNGKLILEAGCLHHLAVHHARLKDFGLLQIERLAREEASHFGHALEGEGFQYLMMGLGIGSSPSEPIALPELAFVTGGGGVSLPGKPKIMSIGFSLGGSIPESPPPSYDCHPQLDQDDENRLNNLERRRIINIEAMDRVAFSHPFYRSAAEALLEQPTRLIADRITKTVERGLFCLSPATSRASARNCDWVYDKLSSQTTAQEQLVECVEAGLASYFPSTRDLCFKFLLQKLPLLPPKYQKNLPTWVRTITFVSFEEIEWINGEAQIPLGKTLGLSYFGRCLGTCTKEEVETELSIIEGAGSDYLSPERAAKVLKYYKHNPSSVSIIAMGRMLSYDEALIRAEATEIWLKLPRTNDEEVLQRIFEENHPSVALAALNGSIAGWQNFNEERRQLLLNGLESFAKMAASAAAMLDKLIVFGRIEHTGQNTPWPIFERLLPAVLHVLPESTAFNDGRLFAVAKDALKNLSPLSIVSICDGWIDWLERKISEGNLPSEFLLGLAEILVLATNEDPTLRTGRVQRILNIQSTGALMVFIADLTDNWNNLAPDEQSLIDEIITTTRSDLHWLQAAVLTRNNVPNHLQQKILGPNLSLNDGPEAILDRIDQKLLVTTIHVYTGRPQPLWWIGTHHSAKERWEPIIDLIAIQPSNPLFDLVWEHLYPFCDDSRVAFLINTVGQEHARLIMNVMLRSEVRQAGNHRPKSWASLLNLAPTPEIRVDWIKEIARYVPAILNNLSELNHWLDGDNRRDMRNQLKSDYVPIELLLTVAEVTDKDDGENLVEKALEIVKKFFEQTPPRILGTYDYLTRILEKLGINDPELDKSIADQREKILAEKFSIEDSFKEPEYHLEGWIKP